MNQIPFRPLQAEIERNKRLVYWEKKGRDNKANCKHV